MDSMKIDKGIAIPPAKRGRGKNYISDKALELIAMSSGDSFFIEEPSKGRQRKLYNTVYKMARRYDIYLQVRYYEDGIRIWKR